MPPIPPAKATRSRLLLCLYISAVLAGLVHHGTSWAQDETATLQDPFFTTSETMPIRGQLKPKRHTILSAGLTGRIDAFPVQEGEQIRKGDLLVRMDCRERRAALSVAKAQIEAAQSRFTVNERLANAQNISLLELDLSRSALAVAKAEHEQIEAMIQFCDIRAPFNAVLTDKLVQAHQHVQAGRELLKLVDNSALEVEVAVPSLWLAKQVEDLPFTILLDEIGTPFKGRFLRSSGQVDPVSQTVRLIGTLDDPSDILIAGMSGRILLQPLN